MYKPYFVIFLIVCLFVSCKKNSGNPASAQGSSSGLVVNLNSNKQFRVTFYVIRGTSDIVSYSQGGLTQAYQYTSTQVKSGDRVTLDLVTEVGATITGTVTYNGKNIDYSIYDADDPDGHEEKDWDFNL